MNEVDRTGWWQRLTGGLARSASRITDGIAVLSRGSLDAGAIEQLEGLLIQADLGVDASARIVERVRAARPQPDALRDSVAAEIEAILAPVAKPLVIDSTRTPFVILVAGVNGSGKTTTIGKLAARYAARGKTVVIAASDTFRAAAIDQLRKWAERAPATFVAREEGADPAGVAYEALERAQAAKADVLLIDTAGRLQNKSALMAELEKILRVVRKLDASAPHAVLLVLDATVGQNAVSQVEAFARAAGVTGLAMTKLDGTAKGGILVALAARFGLPVHFIGVGEGVDDLAPFEARDFARALVGLDA